MTKRFGDEGIARLVSDSSGEPRSGVQAPEEILGLLLAQNAAALTYTAAVAKRTGLTVSEIVALEHLQLARAKGGLTQKELGLRLLLSSGAVSALVDRLEDAGYVERRPALGDRRSRLITLSTAGIEEGRRQHASLGRDLRALLSGFSEGELEVIRRYVAGTKAATERHTRLHSRR